MTDTAVLHGSLAQVLDMLPTGCSLEIARRRSSPGWRVRVINDLDRYPVRGLCAAGKTQHVALWKLARLMGER